MAGRIAILSEVVRVGMRLVHGSDGIVLLASDSADSTHVLLGLVVVDQDFTVLTIAARVVASNLHDAEDGVGLAEDGVHFLQRPVGSLGVEEVTHWCNEGVAVEGLA